MKKLIKVVLFSFVNTCCLHVHSQIHINHVKDSCEIFNGKMGVTKFELDKKQENSIVNILSENVIKYYNLETLYKTELQKKAFQSSSEYKEIYLELIEEKRKLKRKTYYLDFEPSFYERNNLQYNTRTRSFEFINQPYIYEWQFYNDKYIYFNSVLIAKPDKISIKFERPPLKNDVVRQYFSVKIESEATAMKVEKNSTKIRILFTFKLSDVKPHSGFLGSNDFWIMATPIKVYLYNYESGEIYGQF
jgi:hypothetical protein